jgi:hypothetical protein
MKKDKKPFANHLLNSLKNNKSKWVKGVTNPRKIYKNVASTVYNTPKKSAGVS